MKDKEPKAKKPRRQYHHGDLKRAVIGEALQIISEKGYLTLREIASRIGVTHAAPYRHFPNKASLLALVAEEGFRSLLKEMKDAAAEEGLNSSQKLEAIGVTYVRFAAKNTANFMVMFGGGVQDSYLKSEALKEVSGSTLDYVATIIKEGQDRGVFTEGNPRRLAMTAWSMVHGLASLFVEGHCQPWAMDKESLERFTGSTFQTLFKGLRINH